MTTLHTLLNRLGFFCPCWVARGCNEWWGLKVHVAWEQWAENTGLFPVGSLVSGAEVKMSWTDTQEHIYCPEMLADWNAVMLIGLCVLPGLSASLSSCGKPSLLSLPSHVTSSTYHLPYPIFLELPGLTPSEMHPPWKDYLLVCRSHVDITWAVPHVRICPPNQGSGSSIQFGSL